MNEAKRRKSPASARDGERMEGPDAGDLEEALVIGIAAAPLSPTGRDAVRPWAPHDQRTRSAYIFGAVCPPRGTAASLVLPRCNTAAMRLHLKKSRRWSNPEPMPSSCSTKPAGTSRRSSMFPTTLP
jgi:hypothetical protein